MRLNTGKTLILSHLQAEQHFRVRENYLIKRVVRRIDKKLRANASVTREQKRIRQALHSYYRKGKFDDGNGEKILRLMLNLSRRLDVQIDYRILNDILRRRPAVRAAAFGIIEWQRFTPRLSRLLVAFLTSAIIVDEWTYVESADALVHTEARTRSDVHRVVRILANRFLANGFFGTYAAVWLMSKYGTVDELYQILVQAKAVWQPDLWLGRLVGGLAPIFVNTGHDDGFQKLLQSAKNRGAEEVMEFHRRLHTSARAVHGIEGIIMAANPSKRLGITHAKFLMMLSILSNATLSERYKARYINSHKSAWRDIFYRWRARSVVSPHDLRALIKP